MNGLPVEKQTFVEADEPTYRALQYDLLKHIWQANNSCRVEHDNRIEKIENKSKSDKAKNTAVQFGGGVIGGVITAWAFVKAYIATLGDK